MPFHVTSGNVLDMVKTPSQIIEEKGGASVFAKAVGVEPGVVRLWKYRSTIPRRAWPDILEAFPDITLDVLRSSEPPPPQQARTA